jgi:hypothetical protein
MSIIKASATLLMLLSFMLTLQLSQAQNASPSVTHTAEVSPIMTIVDPALVAGTVVFLKDL